MKTQHSPQQHMAYHQVPVLDQQQQQQTLQSEAPADELQPVLSVIEKHVIKSLFFKIKINYTV